LSDSLHVPTLEWEELMWNFQQSIPGSLPGQKWMMAQQIYKLRK
jgi:L-rhamnose mutarotase